MAKWLMANPMHFSEQPSSSAMSTASFSILLVDVYLLWFTTGSPVASGRLGPATGQTGTASVNTGH
jgi:hypothetical protein